MSSFCPKICIRLQESFLKRLDRNRSRSTQIERQYGEHIASMSKISSVIGEIIEEYNVAVIENYNITFNTNETFILSTFSNWPDL